MLGQCNYLHIDTNPGSGKFMSPPAGWQGNGDDFISYFRYLTQKDMAFRSKLMALVYRMNRSHLVPQIEGPFVEQVKFIIESTTRAVFHSKSDPT